jgi:hypothetical protein
MQERKDHCGREPCAKVPKLKREKATYNERSHNGVGDLESIQMLQKASNIEQNYEELEYVQTEMHGPWDVVASSTISTSSVDAQPLLSS